MTDQFLAVKGTTVVVNGLLPVTLEPRNASIIVALQPIA